MTKGEARRVCAWCGAAEPAEARAGESTTHGLCERCLERRVAPDGRAGDSVTPSEASCPGAAGDGETRKAIRCD